MIYTQYHAEKENSQIDSGSELTEIQQMEPHSLLPWLALREEQLTSNVYEISITS